MIASAMPSCGVFPQRRSAREAPRGQCLGDSPVRDAECWPNCGPSRSETAGEYKSQPSGPKTLAFANAARLYQRGLEWRPQRIQGSRGPRSASRALAHAGRSREAAAEYLRAATLCEARQAADLHAGAGRVF